jgi:hypothetical protein
MAKYKFNRIMFGRQNRQIYTSILTALCIFLLAQGIFAEQTASFRKAPYLIFTGNNTQMEVLWQLTSTDTCAIRWGTDTSYGMGNLITLEYGRSHQHNCIITDLVPGAKYYYQVSLRDITHSGSFLAAPPDSASGLKFFIYGDSRSHPETHNKLASAIDRIFTGDSTYQTFILSNGDLVNSGNYESEWDDQVFDPAWHGIQLELANLPFISAIGNHEDSGRLFVKYFPYPFVMRHSWSLESDMADFAEVDQSDGFNRDSVQSKYPSLAGRYWSFDYGPAHIALIDQYSNYVPGSTQFEWLEDDLASSKKPWKFICMHEPGWSAGKHGNDMIVQKHIQPLCLKYDVSMVIAGHNHYYARAVVDGVQHITAGGGGAPLYDPDPKEPYIVAASKSNHFCMVEIKGDSLHFKAVNLAGAVIDSFSIRHAGR